MIETPLGEANYDWLIEGGQRCVGWIAAMAAGQRQRSWSEALLPTMRTTAPALGTLAAYEGGVKGDTIYRLADQAVQPLIHQRGALHRLTEFCTQVGDGDG